MSGEVHILLLSCGDTSEVGWYVPCSHLRDAACREVRSWWIDKQKIKINKIKSNQKNKNNNKN